MKPIKNSIVPAATGTLLAGFAITLAGVFFLASSPSSAGDGERVKKWTDHFTVKERSFSSVGKNRFFILEPGYRSVFESEDARLIITVLDETMVVGGIETRVVEEREWEEGTLREISRNFFAVEEGTGNVFYFGEEVDIYKGGEIVGHEGAWRADSQGCRAGIAMPGTILLGARYYQEHAPVAMDRAEIIADDAKLQTPAGTFEGCLLTKETSGLNKSESEFKTYAPGIGLIQDEDLLLTEHGYPK